MSTRTRTPRRPPITAVIAQRLRTQRRPRLADPGDPSARMFTAVRHRLTLWYCGVLALILLLSGLLLYTGMQTVLLGPVNRGLEQEAQQQAQIWQAQGLPPSVCSASPFERQQGALYIGCFDSSGNLFGNNRIASVAPGFLAPTLAHSALTAGPSGAIDTVDGGNGFGAIRRYAVVVHNPSGATPIGIVQVGIPIGGELSALAVLIKLLLLVGLLTLLCSLAGGLFLSKRALVPAHLAFARQQSFIADASHELRTPLALLRADAEVLLLGRRRMDPDDAALLDDIVIEAAHMGTLAEHLLTLARLDSGAVHIETDVVDLGALAAQVVHRSAALAAKKQVALALESPGEVLVIGDGALLEQVALILLDNAIKYNQPGGTVKLRTSVAEGQAQLEVSDTGIGIPAADLPHLGERFYRVEKARSREAGGAGLGISIAQSIAAAHHGTVTLASATGEGTVATLRLPAATHAPPRTSR